MAIVNKYPGAIQRPTGSYGYPTVGAGRRIKPNILGVVHITDGSSAPWPTFTKSWTFVVERDGTVIQFLDPVTQTPWTNGDANGPDRTNPNIAQWDLNRYNANEYCFITIENVGALTRSGEKITEAQIAANRAIFQWGAQLSGLPMNRDTIIGHYQVNSATRVNCPTFPGDRQRVFGGILSSTLPTPDTAVEDNNMNTVKDIVRFEAPRRFEVKPDANGKVAGYDGRSKEPAKEGVFTAGSPASASALVTISGDAVPGGYNAIKMVEVVDGYFAGLYVPFSRVQSLDISPPSAGASEADIEAAREAGQREGADIVKRAAVDAAAKFGV